MDSLSNHCQGRLVASRSKRGRFQMAKVEINTRAPDFSLEDFHGNTVSLSEFSGKKNILIVFNRGFV